MAGILDGRVIIVTGAGNGIGEASAMVLARHGARLMLADLSESDADRTAAAVREAGGEAIACACDISDESAVIAMVRATVDHYGRLDGALNNAGAPPRIPAPLADMDSSVFDDVIAVNLRGTFTCMKHELAAMTNHEGSAIVNMSSNGGRYAFPMMSCYGAAKAGIISMGQTAAVEVGHRGIRINTICPGLIETKRIRAAIDKGVNIMEGMNIPLGRMGKPEEIGELAAWLLSPLASYVTGETVSADGGQVIVA